MVVIPSGASVSKVFAISKYEITINDYNLYCQASGDCSKKTGSGRLPITDISIENAKAYTQWLSQKTAKNYSLPSSQQWLYAAKSNNKAQYNDVNCRIKFGSKLLKGKILLAANTGQSNPWGLMNVVGNAREFVVDGGNTVARGGAHIDPIKDCSVNKKLDNIASGDQYTGFRIVRAIN
ncbi:formylglycine-generating enzyme family protein [sulfur-oxidizing endosymbiont of Gigantopelta aegis]|uniref:formylglycine-generating enzyme family protein n=1 Tax=sulfur-oxidizing endosymbiont of Gigantopelta aegis TaxID=2794934 RepID=UPI0018DC44B2|nr:SUMF1/EgtB/PvdO family nonheme iron enzyme [sulfur-oxidizing endosymbiont of Gigantopelta aegis]